MTNFLDELDHLEESQSLEFKLADRALPQDLWSTYSAFANASGGKIVLGVKDEVGPNGQHAFAIAGVDDPQQRIEDFWKAVRNRQIVSANVMLPDGVYALDVEGKTVVVIDVPRAERSDKPVKVLGKKHEGMVAWIRQGSGDFRCTEDELRRMDHDALLKADGGPIEELGLDALSKETVSTYRQILAATHQRLLQAPESDEDLLYQLHAIARGTDGELHPTMAGLLAFGLEYEITGQYPRYHLDYREELDPDLRWTHRIDSADGSWSGNLIDFYFQATDRIDRALPQPFGLADNGFRHTSRTQVNDAAHEAIANALIHAYYGGSSQVTVVLGATKLSVGNSGTFLVDPAEAIDYLASEVRNPNLARIFQRIGVVDRAGSGLAAIYDIWNRFYGEGPRIVERYRPDEVLIELTLEGGRKAERKRVSRGDIVDYVRQTEGVTAAALADALGMKLRTAQYSLRKLVDEGVLAVERRGRANLYRLP